MSVQRDKYTSKRKRYGAEDHTAAEAALTQMTESPLYNTDIEKLGGSGLSFVDRHMYYLNTHTSVDPEAYLSNLRLMTRNRN